VIRGGRNYRGWDVWYGYAWRCRSAHRDGFDPGFSYLDLGFRTVLAPGQ